MDELKQLKADLAGMQTALGTAIRALMKTHPNPAALAAAMELEHQESIAVLTNMSISDRVLEAYHVAWTLVGPKDPDDQASGA